MKRSILLIMVMLLLICGCAGVVESDFVIKVSGTSGLEFSGSYMVTMAGGESVSKSVDGIVPAQYTVRGTIVSCAFQKQSEAGTLRVEIAKGGKVVSESETSAAYGVVSVATR